VSVTELANTAQQSTSSTTKLATAVPTEITGPDNEQSASTFKEQLQTGHESLWSRAYNNLKKEDDKLVEKYEKLLSRKLDGGCESAQFKYNCIISD
jgi:hypothetical protein